MNSEPCLSYKLANIAAEYGDNFEECQEAFEKFLGKEIEVVARVDDGKWACDEHQGFARATHGGWLVGLKKLHEEDYLANTEEAKERGEL